MTETRILLPEAKADVADGFLWYEEQSMGLGMEFLRCVETALFAIQRTPLGYPMVHLLRGGNGCFRFPTNEYRTPADGRTQGSGNRPEPRTTNGRMALPQVADGMFWQVADGML
jgi:hypothetical protein